MRTYIVNLTDQLIRKHHCDRFYETLSEEVFWNYTLDRGMNQRTLKDYDDNELRHGFVKHVALDLVGGDVSQMSPKKLGEIMCSFEMGDIRASRDDLMERCSFSGDSEDFLKQLVSVCLAYAIFARFESCRTRPQNIPAFFPHRRPQASAK